MKTVQEAIQEITYSAFPPRTDESMILQLTITKDGLAEVEEIPVKIEAGRPVPIGQDLLR